MKEQLLQKMESMLAGKYEPLIKYIPVSGTSGQSVATDETSETLATKLEKENTNE